MRGAWHLLQFHDPDIQLCVYEKGGTKHFKRLHCSHIHGNPSNTSELPDFNQCWNRQPKPYGPEDDKVVFLRDPLDRFLSGFLDKCVRHRDVVDHCEPTTVYYDKDTSPVTNTTLLENKQKFFELYVDTFPLQWNMHFIPQSLYCGGLYRDIQQSYKFIGNMGDTFYQDLQRLQSLYPQLEAGIEKIFQLSTKKSEFATGVVGRNIGVETGAAGKVLDYYTPRTVRRVLEYYSIDYMLLNLSVPSWAEDMLRRDEEEGEEY
jgi:hypothetical protein